MVTVLWQLPAGLTGVEAHVGQSWNGLAGRAMLCVLCLKGVSGCSTGWELLQEPGWGRLVVTNC